MIEKTRVAPIGAMIGMSVMLIAFVAAILIPLLAGEDELLVIIPLSVIVIMGCCGIVYVMISLLKPNLVKGSVSLSTEGIQYSEGDEKLVEIEFDSDVHIDISYNYTYSTPTMGPLEGYRFKKGDSEISLSFFTGYPLSDVRKVRDFIVRCAIKKNMKVSQQFMNYVDEYKEFIHVRIDTG